MITLTPVPPPRKPPPPPRPAPLPAVPPASGRSARRAVKIFAAVVLLFGLLLLGKLIDLLPNPSTSGVSSTSAAPATVACPTAAAKWLSGEVSDAQLVAQYATDTHVITLCRDPSSGQVYYDGQAKGGVVSANTHISLKATRTATGYSASNRGYVYEIRGSDLILTNNGKQISRSALSPAGP